jgi:hypothetical protein
MRKRLTAVALAIAAIAAPIGVQAQSAGAGAVVAKEPGKVAMADAVRVSASVQAIDKDKRLVTLKGPKGNTFVVHAGPEVKNFDQIKVGDEVVVRYVEALTLELKKASGGIRERVEREGAVAAQPGERPGAAVGRQVTVVADVIGKDAKRQTLRLRGVERTIDLKVPDPKQFKLVKVGDQIEATFTEAVALSVEPAAPSKAAPAKK